MAAHDILVAASATAPPDQAVEMLAEAAEACEYAADPERMLEAAQSAWDQLAPDASERARCFANLALGMALIYNGRKRRRPPARRHGAARDATRRPTRACSPSPPRARCGCARPSAGARW